MPTIYRLREFSPDECEVKGAIAALEACHTDPTPEAVQKFSELPKTRISKALAALKKCGLVYVVRR